MRNSVPFKAVRPKKASTLIAEQLLQLLEQGQLRPGTRLPPERELAERFGVNRQSIREALSALQLLGVVETRAGSGTLISPHALRSTDLLSQIGPLDEQENPFEIMEARIVIEPAAVRLAAARASASNLARIRLAIDEFAASIPDEERLARGDLHVHLAMAHGSGNSVFIRFVESVVRSADQWLWRMRREQAWNRAHALRYLEQHRQIYEAIKTGDGRVAARIMRLHLRDAWGVLKGEPR